MTSIYVTLQHLGYVIDQEYEIHNGELRWFIDPRHTPEQIEAAAHDAAVAWITAKIKAEAQQRILARLPQWRQNNATARAVELISLGEASGPEWEALQAAWGWVKATREHSNALEAQAAQAEDPMAFDFTAGWPE